MVMKHIIQFSITRENGVYTADGVNVPIVTEGKTFEKLQDNIYDAVSLYFEGEDPAELGFAPSPAVLTNFELAPLIHGRKV
jgi:predicted RNase H-like HicB family nuclease